MFTLLNLFLLHRILLRVTLSTPPRVLGLAFFALNKVHLTAIGWINVFEIIVTLMHFLLILLFLLRYLQEGRKWDYCLALGGFLLTVFSRDYSIVLLAVVVAIFYLRALDERGNPARWRSALGMLVPFCMVAALHFFARYSLGQWPPTNVGNYTISFDPARVLTELVSYAGVLFNLSMIDGLGNEIGRYDFSWLLVKDSVVNDIYRYGLLGYGLAVISTTVLVGLRRRRSMCFSLLWAIIIITPTLLVVRHTLYYMYEAVAAMGILLAMSTDQLQIRNRVAVLAWTPLLLLMAPELCTAGCT